MVVPDQLGSFIVVFHPRSLYDLLDFQTVVVGSNSHLSVLVLGFHVLVAVVDFQVGLVVGCWSQPLGEFLLCCFVLESTESRTYSSLDLYFSHRS